MFDIRTDTVTFLLGSSVLALFAFLVYLSVGVFGVLLLPFLLMMVYTLPGGILRTTGTDGVRLALLVLDGVLIGWILAEYLGSPPLDGSGEFVFSVGTVLFALGFASMSAGLYGIWRYYHVLTTPTSDVASVDEGTVEIEGEIEPARETVTAPVSNEDCVVYKYDAAQRRRFLSKKYSSVVESDRDGCPFYVDDGTGRVLVDPDGSRIDVDNREVERFEPQNSGYDRETTVKEVRVPDEGHLYVFGTARWSDEHGQIVIGDGLPLFKISESSESELTERYRRITLAGFVVALLSVPSGMWLTLRSSGVL
jgi:hypothetical protein